MIISNLIKDIRSQLTIANPAKIANPTVVIHPSLAELAPLATKLVESHKNSVKNLQQIDDSVVARNNNTPEQKIMKAICDCGYRAPFCACGFYKLPG